jgi:hypothetical protein
MPEHASSESLPISVMAMLRQQVTDLLKGKMETTVTKARKSVRLPRK